MLREEKTGLRGDACLRPSETDKQTDRKEDEERRFGSLWKACVRTNIKKNYM